MPSNRRQRITDYTAWAARYGFAYAPQDPMLAGLSRAHPFDVGSGQTGHDVFRGMYRGRLLVFGEYRYNVSVYTRYGVSRREFAYQVVAIVTPGPGPFLDVAPNYLPHDPAALTGAWSQLALAHNFHHRFTVDSSDLEFSSTLFSPPYMRWLIADPRAAAWPWRLDGSWLMTIRIGNLNLAEVNPHADFLNDLIDNAPAPVWA